MRACAMALLCLGAGLASASASAATVRLVIERATPGVLHDASAACERVAGGEVCTEGAGARAVSGVLVADLSGGRFVGVRGVLEIEGGERLIVERGTIDFGAAGPDALVAQLFTRSHGVFSFLDRAFVGGDNALEGGWLHLNGTNDGSTGERLGLQFAALLRIDAALLRRAPANAVAEPSAVLLLVAVAMGFFGLTRWVSPA